MKKESNALDIILANLNIKELNGMQLAAIDAANLHQNVMIYAATGSGKTLAFLLPLLQLIDKTLPQSQAIIIVPSRELALQIEQVFKAMKNGFTITCCYGGHQRLVEEKNLRANPNVIVGTPGRISDHIDRGNITCETIRTIVLDEFDKSIEIGFTEEMKYIIGKLKNVEKRLLTSATMAKEIPDFIELKTLKTLNFLAAANHDNGLTLKVLKCLARNKNETLFKLLCSFGNTASIVFCNHRETVETISEFISSRGLLNSFYHGGLEQQDRDRALIKFRNGSVQVLVTTDLASRGLDIDQVKNVVHYHFPLNEDIYTHRNGRTARMDKSGNAIMMIGENERLPEYISSTPANVSLDEKAVLPNKPAWVTLFIAAGKKDKINKVDIVGFFTNTGGLQKEDVGLIEVKDYLSFVAIAEKKYKTTMQLISDKKIKNRKIKIVLAN